MHGLMMDLPLQITAIMRHADGNFPDTEVVSVTLDQPLHRTSFGEVFRRSRKLANALKRAGVTHGDRVGTLAWNDHRHLELYYAVSCMGAVLHTINPRLFPEQVRYIIGHAEDRLLFVDPLLLPLVEKLLPALPGVRQVVVLTDAAHLPASGVPGLISYEAFIGAEPDAFDWPAFDENTAAALCYTSGTTGNPKGVLYSHRSTVLHALVSSALFQHEASEETVAMAVVPMFHACAWGWPYCMVMNGTKLVLPGPKMGDGATLAALIRAERVTIAAGVPTIWQALLNHARQTGESLAPLQSVAIGGSATPQAMLEEFRDRHGIDARVAWGMTETSPLGTYNRPHRSWRSLAPEEVTLRKLKAGQTPFGVEMKIVDPEGRELPRDGRAFGALKVRGPWVCRDYFRAEPPGQVLDADGWFPTGDVATIDPDGYMQITDRSKDVIKSGGEWISSIDLENVASGHPKVLLAAVIGARHPKWDERPLLVVVPRPGETPTRAELLEWFEGKVAKWWIPDDVAIVDRIPMTATGKVSKLDLRRQFADYHLPGC